MFKVICDHTPPLRVVGALIGAPLVRINGRSEEDNPPDADACDAIRAATSEPKAAEVA
jgi:hypothetical protein